MNLWRNQSEGTQFIFFLTCNMTTLMKNLEFVWKRQVGGIRLGFFNLPCLWQVVCETHIQVSRTKMGSKYV